MFEINFHTKQLMNKHILLKAAGNRNRGGNEGKCRRDLQSYRFIDLTT